MEYTKNLYLENNYISGLKPKGWHVNSLRFISRNNSKNNLQYLYRKKNQFNYNSRKRKFKLRVDNGHFIRKTSSGLLRPRSPLMVGLKANHACRLTYPMFIGAEKSVMPTKSKVWLKFRKFPDFFVTRKSSKSRMGKGKGKIFGRVLKIKKGEIVFDANIANPLKTKKWVDALKKSLPTTTKLVYQNRKAELFLKNFFFSKTWKAFKKKTKKKKIYFNQPKKKTKKTIYIAPTEAMWERSYLEDFYQYYAKPKVFDEPYLHFLRKFMFRARNLNRGRKLVPFSKPRVLGGWWRTKHDFLKYSSWSKMGMSGGLSRSAITLVVSGRLGLQTFAARPFLPDSDGFYGIYKGSNALFKKKKLRDLYSTRRYQTIPLH